MTVVSYRIYCQECPNDAVIREQDMATSQWSIESKYNHTGLCPACNPAAEPKEGSEYSKQNQPVAFEQLDNIGEKGATNLREAGIETRGDVANATDDEILSVSWVGEGGLKSIRQEVQI